MKEVLRTRHGGTLFEVNAECDRNRVMVVFPGGGYVDLADYEGEPVAERFAQLGYSTYVMNYSVIPDGKNRINGLLEDVHEAVAYLKKEYSDAKLVLCGFSAGGNLIANYGNRYGNVDSLILCYAVVDWKDLSMILSADTGNIQINEKTRKLRDSGYLSLFGTKKVTDEMLESVSPICSVSENSVPTFLWQSQNDFLVSSRTTLRYYQSLSEKHIPAELHIYKDGQHGSGLGEGSELSSWVSLADRFVSEL